MTINLPEEISRHFNRVVSLAEEAADDNEQGFQSRAAAMNTLSTMLKDLTKAQESIVHMERLMKVESIVIEVCKECLSDEGLTHFIEKLDAKLAAI